MVQMSAGMDAGAGAPGYERHRPEKTLLFQLVEQYYPAFVTQLAAEGKVLRDYVYQECSRSFSSVACLGGPT